MAQPPQTTTWLTSTSQGEQELHWQFEDFEHAYGQRDRGDLLTSPTFFLFNGMALVLKLYVKGVASAAVGRSSLFVEVVGNREV